MVESIFINRLVMNIIAPKLQKCWTHKIAFKGISKMLKQTNFFNSQPSKLPINAPTKFYLSTTSSLSFRISSVALNQSSSFYGYPVTESGIVTYQKVFYVGVGLIRLSVDGNLFSLKQSY